MSDRFVVSGVVRWDQRWLQTETLVFEPGAELRFTQDSVKLGGGRVVIMARTIQCDQAKPGSITWEKPSFKPNRVFGKAAPGQSFDPTGNGDHSQGRGAGDGTTGIAGDTGDRGGDSPILELWALSIPTVGPIIDFRGQDGQEGGVGQEGGDGGNGEKGLKGDSGIFDCSRGGQWGGRAGNGGSGGDGGHGGDGGRGGTVVIVAPKEQLSNLSDKTRCLVSGGASGVGGHPAQGGKPGRGGDGGSGDGLWCRDESRNREARPQVGSSGPSGNAGASGQQGREGNIVTVPTTPEAFDARLKGGANL